MAASAACESSLDGSRLQSALQSEIENQSLAFRQ
jgi:hypothetical protein